MEIGDFDEDPEEDDDMERGHDSSSDAEEIQLEAFWSRAL